jgi:hypothetical protein
LKAADFLRDVRRRFPHVVVIVITGYGSIEGAVEATKMGAFDYLTKPIVDDEIRVVVEKAVRQQSLLFENQTLKQQLDLRFGLENVVGHDYKMLKIFDLVDAVADSRTTVLMCGESGTGKSLLARAIHHRSSGGTSRSSKSVAARCPKRCWSPNFSVTSKAPSPARSPTSPAVSSPLTAERFSWMRSTAPRPPCRSSCCAYYRSGNSSRSARHRPRAWTCA